MPRPRKCKNVCKLPDIKYFEGKDKNENVKPIIMDVEEYEVIRLMDKENLTQEECAIQMNVSRPTVQLLYSSARRKVAEFLTTGTSLKIEGGTYEVCSNQFSDCNCTHCKCNNRDK